MKTSPRSKTPGFWAIILMAICTTFLSFETRGQDREDLVATWTGTEFSFDQVQGPDISAMIDGGRSLHIGGQLILQANNEYQIKDPAGQVNGKGNWKMNGNESFTTIDTGGDQTIHEIIELANNILITKHSVELETPDGEKIEGEITLRYTKQ